MSAAALASVAAVVPASPAAAQEAPAGGGTAQVDKVGWWNVAVGPVEGEPDNPLRQALAPVPAPPSNVPANAVGVGAVAGEPTKVAAVGILFDAPARATASVLKLTVKESPDPGATVAADRAAITACPTTGFWGEARNAAWRDRPQADCGQAVDGVRNADGTWAFDLLALATSWLDPDSGVGQNGVLLAEKVDAPAGFEVSFLDLSASGITVEFAASGGDDFAGDPFGPTEDASGPLGGGLELGSGSAGGDLDLGRGDTGAPPTPTDTGGSAAGSGDDAGDDESAAPPAATVRASRVGDTVGNLSGATWLLIPLALGVAALLAVSLGTNEPPVGRRAGGVSRALARREIETEERP